MMNNKRKQEPGWTVAWLPLVDWATEGQNNRIDDYSAVKKAADVLNEGGGDQFHYYAKAVYRD